MRILGIDPGTNFMGYAVVRKASAHPELVDYGTLKLKYVKNAHVKLHKIYVSICHLIVKYEINEVAIEAPFYGKNVQSMLKLGRAQGVAMAAAMQSDKKITEYSPKRIKMSITGNGNASKEQVAAMLEHVLKHPVDKTSLDATDALAVAICHCFGSNGLGGSGKSNSWESFIKQNPKRMLGN